MWLIRLYRWLFASPRFYRLNRLLFRLSTCGLGVLNHESAKVSGEAHLINDILPQHLKSATPIIFDVGANVGDYSKALARQFPGATIHAFEPNPKLQGTLSSIAPGRVIAHAVGLGEKAATMPLYDVKSQDGSAHASLYQEVITSLHHKDASPVEVQIETLDDFAGREQIGYIDFLKIDTEGNELAVLKGAEKYLRAGRIGCVHFEFNEMNTISRVFLRDFQQILSGYRLYRLLPRGLLPLDDKPVLVQELFAYQNIFAIPD